MISGGPISSMPISADPWAIMGVSAQVWMYQDTELCGGFLEMGLSI
jgi:hypothetical protein